MAELKFFAVARSNVTGLNLKVHPTPFEKYEAAAKAANDFNKYFIQQHMQEQYSSQCGVTDSDGFFLLPEGGRDPKAVPPPKMLTAPENHTEPADMGHTLFVAPLARE